jgi:hypothetical protein
MSKAESDEAVNIPRRTAQDSVDFEGKPHLLPFVGTADEHASESGFAGQLDGRTIDDQDGNAEHSQQRARRRATAAAVGSEGEEEEEEEDETEAGDGKAGSSAAGDLADGLELLRKAAEKAGPPRDPRVEEISQRALSRLRKVEDPKSAPDAARVTDSTIQGAAAQAGEEILSLIQRVSHRIVRLTEEEEARLATDEET